MPFVRVRNAAVLFIVGLYLLLSHGFMQLRFPPVAGAGVPIGELTLILFLLTVNHFKVWYRLNVVVFLFPFFLWWSFGIARAFIGVPDYGFWALRDATHVIESLFLIVGFAFAFRPDDIDRFFDWLPKLLIVACVYALSYPFASALRPYSPTIWSGAGYSATILFSYTSISVMLLLAVAYLVIFKERSRTTLIVEGFLLGYVVLVFQARTIYLQIVALTIFFLFFRGRALTRGVFIILLVFLALLILPLAGLQIQGRLGQEASFDFVINHILAIAGIESEGLEGAAGGVDLRLGWWRKILEDWTASFGNFIFGMGYGMPLTDHMLAGGVIIREPHNSYISIIARIGLIGAVAFLWIHAILLRSWYQAYKSCVRLKWRTGQNRLMICMVFFILIWVYAIGEDAFEKPYFAIPYYFFWGIVLQMNWHLTRNRAMGRTKSPGRSHGRRFGPTAAHPRTGLGRRGPNPPPVSPSVENRFGRLRPS